MKSGWGHVCAKKPKEKSRWNCTKSTDKMKNKGFGGDVNPNWSFPKGTFFKYHKWGKNLYENENYLLENLTL